MATKSFIPSKKKQIEEIVKCGKDPIYFMNNYVRIQHPDRGTIPFSTYPFQDTCIEAFNEHRFNIILKSRQLGISTVVAAYCLWYALFYKDKNILVIATKMSVAKNFIQKVRFMFKSLPTWLVLTKINEDSTQAIGFENGSVVRAVPTNEDAGRSFALSLLVVDECAHIPNMEELWLGLYPTISTGGRTILLSTPNGVGNLFHKVWTDCDQDKKKNNFHGINLPWHVHPEHDKEWFDDQCKDLNDRAINQELLCSFVGSGEQFLTIEDVNWMQKSAVPPIERTGPDMNLWIWKYPRSNAKYLISADVGRGDAADFSAFHVIDMEEDEIVAEYFGKIPPDKFAQFMMEIGLKYNTALICNENNGIGLACSIALKNAKYPNLYYEKYAKNIVPIIPADDEEDFPGITMTGKNRTPMLAKFEEVIRNRRLRVYSTRLYNEVQTFIIKGNKAQAMRGYNDDLTMAAAIGCWVYDVAGGYNKQSLEVSKAMLAGMSRSATVLNSGGWANVGNSNNYEQPIIPMSFSRKNYGPSVNNASIQRNMPQKPPHMSDSEWSKYMQFHWLLK